MISLSDPILGEEERQTLCSVIDGGWLTMGDRVAAFEKAFASLHGIEDAVAVNSCTAALHLCLAALKIGPGDEVLLPSLTFVATANAILYVGATPVFVDIESGALPHISLGDAKRKCTSRTKAVIVMHYGGYVVDLPRWRSFADANGLKLIEDSAHAPAAEGVAKWADASAFSFFSNKNMTTAEGGMVCARDEVVLDTVRRMRAHGMTTGTLDRFRGHAHSYDVTMLGYNYRMDELRAAIGLVQLSRLSQWNARRRELSLRYRQGIRDWVPNMEIPFDEMHNTSAHLMPVLLPEKSLRPAVMTRLREQGIQSSIHYPPIHQFSYYRDGFPGVRLHETEKFFAREISLPLHPALAERDVDRIVEVLHSIIPHT